MLYFAYGSNMSRLLARVPSAEFVTAARLEAHRLAFHKAGADGSGKCDALATGDPAHCVFGVVFEIAAAEKEHLDRIEGLGSAMPRNGAAGCCRWGRSGRLPLLRDPHRRRPCAVCLVQGPRSRWRAATHGLPADYVRAIEAVTVIDDPDPARARRELAIY